MTTTTTDRLIRSQEAAALYDVNVSTVRRWAREGTLPCVRVTKKSLRFRESDLAGINSHSSTDFDNVAQNHGMEAKPEKTK